ncbi:GNAT family N-acetyltransferase [Bacillus marinisedimentorum]|uniref:GNAT family N-acetyltransferase n=1 Tax=Bacillus marinisedimentorum TaxID=1821260 RepID=UPI0008734B17|nr:GNAT family protein [Bacillus marinisedimentorum]
MYKFRRLTQKEAEEIAFRWQYAGEYAFYDMEADEEDLEEFLDEEKRGNHYFAVLENDDLIGFFSFVKAAEEQSVDIGLGMRPDQTGKGKGYEFLMAGLGFCKQVWKPNEITLAVALFNKRAIKVYEKAGFEAAGTYEQHTNGGTYEFLKMVYKK